MTRKESYDEENQLFLKAMGESITRHQNSPGTGKEK